MAKTVAQLATEQGLDEKEIVKALRLLASRHTQKKRRRSTWGYETGPLLNARQTARLLGLDQPEVERLVRPLPDWTEKMILDNLFAFHTQHGRWPKAKEWRSWNGLPSPYFSHMMINWHRRTAAGSGYSYFTGRKRDIEIRAWDGWQRLIAKDKRCTPEMAVALTNVLARKEAIDRIGFETFIKRGVATIRDSDEEFGTLYELPGETSREPMVLLKVVNSTPEPDGSFSDYYLRVPPDQTNVRDALKWTFGGDERLGQKPYRPLVET